MRTMIITGFLNMVADTTTAATMMMIITNGRRRSPPPPPPPPPPEWGRNQGCVAMVDPLFDGDDEANTPLEAEEREALIPTYITTRAELNEAEQAGIADADRWAFSRKRDVLDARFLTMLHKRMFGQVWRWAGTFRQTPRNIGIEAYRIPVEVQALINDVRYWVEHETYPPDEIAIRFHYRLVAIHPFPNGNGRHGRLAADLLAVQLGRPPFEWGGGYLVAPDELRTRYIEAQRAGDNHDIGPLLAFARS